MEGFRGGFSKPIGSKTGIGKWLDDRKTARLASEVDYTGSDLYKSASELAKAGESTSKSKSFLLWKIWKSMVQLKEF